MHSLLDHFTSCGSQGVSPALSLSRSLSPFIILFFFTRNADLYGVYLSLSLDLSLSICNMNIHEHILHFNILVQSSISIHTKSILSLYFSRYSKCMSPSLYLSPSLSVIYTYRHTYCMLTYLYIPLYGYIHNLFYHSTFRRSRSAYLSLSPSL